MRVVSVLVLLLLSSVTYAENTNLFAYVPDDQELQYYMNLYERLRAIDSGNAEKKDLSDMLLNLEKKDSPAYETYQRLLLESYLRHTKNPEVRGYINSILASQEELGELGETLTALYASTPENYSADGKNLMRYRTTTDKIDENIDLFNMKESSIMDGQVGLMLFDNDWSVFSFKRRNDRDPSQTSLVFGGGTNSLSISIKATPWITLQMYKDKIVGNDYYQKKFESYTVQEIEPSGILSRSGGSNIYLGVGSGKDKAFPTIQQFSAIIFMYSEKRHTGYQVEYFMNISPKNNNYIIRDHLFNQLILQAYMTYLN